MKRQYLGDSKDSFKWDYHHFLLETLGYRQFKIAWMMTPDDAGTDGRTAPELFPARPEILQLCRDLRATRDPALLLGLPKLTGARYQISFHDSAESLQEDNRSGYFSSIKTKPKQVVLLDPDKGFEPERSSSDKHLRYAELDQLLQAIAPDTLITVFQHHRRKKFPEDFARIRERMHSGYSCALYWHSLMFVCVSSSPTTIQHVHAINCQYATQRPVKTLA